MDAKRTPASSITTPAVTATDARERGSHERSWLVFRLGAHTMCASTLDVEGIIEPKPSTPLPFTPAHVLGSFMFRDQVATAISLRRKLAVEDGEDSAQGPFIVARVGDELAAFWVDEVKEVMGEKDVAWQPMPDMLRSRIFDRYTIARGELILHTSFVSLLEAETASIPARWPATLPEASADAEPGTPEVAGAASAAVAVPDADQRPPSPPVAPPGPASQEPEGIVEHDATAPQQRSEIPKHQERIPFVGEDASRVAPAKGSRAGGTGPGETAPKPRETRRPHRVPGHEPAVRTHSPGSSHARSLASEDRARMRNTGDDGARDRTPALPRATPYEGARIAAAGDPRAIHSESIVGNARQSDPVASRRPHQAERRSPRALAGIALALGAALLATFVLWPEGTTKAPLSAGRAENGVRGTGTADSPPQQPRSVPVAVVSAPASSLPPDTAPATPTQTSPATRVATVATEDLSLTIDRPAKPAARTPTVPGEVGAEIPAAASARQQAPAAAIVHVVVRGDTLWDISRKHLGDPFRYPELVRLSGIKNPDLIHPGDIVRIRVNEKRR